MEISLSHSQHKFLSMDKKFRAYVGGFGSGKTFSGCLDLATFALKNPNTAQGYFAPTYPLIRDIFYQTMAEAWEMIGESVNRKFTAQIKSGDKEVNLFCGSKSYGKIICRTMDNPANIVGFKIARALVDEIDIMRTEKATVAWNKIIARMRLNVKGEINSIGLTTTPEGFKFVYKMFKDNPTESYGMVQASTYENLQYLPDDYINTLKETYTPELIKAYINGEFVNLTSGTVYPQFDRVLNNCNYYHDGKEPVHIGMDFNVGKMSAIIHVLRDKMPCAVGEILGAYDTPEMIKLIKQRLWEEISNNKFKQLCQIYVYPDASGKSRKTNDASTSDIALLKEAGFIVMAKPSNPTVKDRITSVNAMFCNAEGGRRYLINTTSCPYYTKSREQQAYNANGEPDKTHDTDHPNDAGDYYISYAFPAKKPSFLYV